MSYSIFWPEYLYGILTCDGIEPEKFFNTLNDEYKKEYEIKPYKVIEIHEDLQLCPVLSETPFIFKAGTKFVYFKAKLEAVLAFNGRLGCKDYPNTKVYTIEATNDLNKYLEGIDYTMYELNYEEVK